MKKIAYLHCHTSYSEKDGLATPKMYRDKILEMKENDDTEVVGLAVTEHANLFSMVKHYQTNSEVTNAIIGCEIYHCVDRNIEDDNNKYHMILLAKNEVGLHNLYRLVSDAGLHKLKGKQKEFPRSDHDNMKKYGEGIIALSACIGGIIPQRILEGKYDEAKQLALYYKSIFDDFYLEVQPHDIPEQHLVNLDMVKISKETGIELVITTDSHYIEKSDKQYHDILKKLARQLPYNVSAHMASYDELYNYCINNNIPISAIENTVKIAEMCNVNPKPKNSRGLLPEFPCPKGYTEESYLREIVTKFFFEFAIKKKFTDIPLRLERMNYELDIICSTGFSGYFLILWDWFKWCRDNDILMGPGRGSGAGSLVAYLLNITTIDPIKNGLIFERFLNMERLEFPDIDSDISKRDRPKGIEYLLSKYGHEHVSQIVTFSKYGLKNTIKAAMSALVPDSFEEANNITKLIPASIDGGEVTYDLMCDIRSNPDSYADNLSQNEIKQIENIMGKLDELFAKYPEVYAAVTHIKGAISGTGLHAGGVIVSSKPLFENLPIMSGSDTAVLPVVQIEMKDLDFFKALKIDVLGLNTLTQISDAMKLTGLGYDWYDSEDYTDPLIYEYLRNGNTTDTFQMSSFTASKMIKDMKVNCFEDIVVVNAGNRPGPLAKNKETGKSMVDTFIERRASNYIPSIDSRIDKILEPTLGCIWYQEQCIALGQVMAGYSLGMADLRIRKVLGKKLLKKIPEIRNEFIYGKKSIFDNDENVIGISQENSPYCIGAVNNGFTEEVSIQIFDAMAEFARYSFNKSHSAAYGSLSYKTGWLSYYYPAEWGVSCLSSHDKQEKITATLSHCKKRGVKILPPDINKSEIGFTIEVLQDGSKAIRYGLSAIKDVGAGSVKYIMEVRENNYFTDFMDFYNKVHNTTNVAAFSNKFNKNGKSLCPVDKSTEVALIKAGAFDTFEENRYKLLNDYMINIKKYKSYEILNDKEYVRKHKLQLEKEVMGSYVSEHPLDPFPYVNVDSLNDNDEIEITGIVKKTTIKNTKNGGKYTMSVIETKDSRELRLMLFGNKGEKYKERLKKNSIIVAYGTYNKQYNNVNIDKIKTVIKKSQIREENEEDGIEDFSTNNTQNNIKPQINIPIREDPLMDMITNPVDEILQQF